MSYQDRNPQGFAETHRDENRKFENLTQLLLILDQFSEQAGDSQGKFVPDTENRRDPSDGQKPLASFRICIMFRQNNTWQGTCEWIEERETACFRSTLELVQLMDGALTKKQK